MLVKRQWDQFGQGQQQLPSVQSIDFVVGCKYYHAITIRSIEVNVILLRKNDGNIGQLL